MPQLTIEFDTETSPGHVNVLVNNNKIGQFRSGTMDEAVLYQLLVATHFDCRVSTIDMVINSLQKG